MIKQIRKFFKRNWLREYWKAYHKSRGNLYITTDDSMDEMLSKAKTGQHVYFENDIHQTGHKHQSFMT